MVIQGDVINESSSFTRSYTAITNERNILFAQPSTSGSVAKQNGPPPFTGPFTRDGPTLLGAFFLQFGGLFRPSSVNLVARRIMNMYDQGSGGASLGDFGDNLQLQPEVIPAIDQDFTFGGKCTVTSSNFGASIVGHSCLYDLCLGSSTDCIFVYAGTRFDFSPLSDFPRNRPLAVNTQNKGLLDPTATIDFVDPPGPANLVNPLPPSFPGFVFGGVGNYEGIKGSFDLITIAQRSINPNLREDTSPPTAAPTLTDAPTPDFQSRRRDLQEENEERTATKDYYTQSSTTNDIQEEEKNNEEQQRDLQRSDLTELDDPVNVIVQKIFLVTNVRLPLGPKAI
jgi:hypothetical protein